MTGKGNFYSRKFLGLFAGRKAFIAAFLIAFFLGYNLTVSGLQECRAAPTTGMPFGAYTPAQPPIGITVPVVAPSVCTGDPYDGCAETPCDGPPGMAVGVTGVLYAVLHGMLMAAANALESVVYNFDQFTLLSEYIQNNWLEVSMIDWWNTMWYYNLLPSLQQMTRELNVELALQTLQLHAFADASALIETERDYGLHQIDDQQKLPDEQVCVAATQMGGFTRAEVFPRPMRQAWEAKSVAPGLNETTDPDGNPYPGATSAGGMDLQRYSDWQNIFCDKDGNSITDVHCGNNPDANLINMDILPVKYLFNTLTINVNDTTKASAGGTEGQNLELGLEYLINNLVGLPEMEAVTTNALLTPGGKQGYLLRRSYLARYAAIRAVPDFIAGWRMPGSQMGKWIKDIRETSGQIPDSLMQDTNNQSGGFSQAAAGIELTGGISKNPSYKEVMHALSIDRFNSGRYAMETITDPAKIDLEKLDVSVFYLMQLRDYYELLERTALTLAVQVSLLADQQDPGNPNAAQPFNVNAPPGG